MSQVNSARVAVRRELARHVRSLNLQIGDILLVSDPNLMRYFMEVEWPEHFKKLRTPILYAPQGSVDKIPFEQLEQVYAKAKAEKHPLLVV